MTKNEINEMIQHAEAKHAKVAFVAEAANEAADRINAHVVIFHADDIGADKVLNNDGSGRSVGTYDEVNDTWRKSRREAGQVASRLRARGNVSNVRIVHWAKFISDVAEQAKRTVDAVRSLAV